MRVLTCVLVFALLGVCASGLRLPAASSSLASVASSLGVDVPYKWCGSSSDDATIQSIVSNEFPPVKGDTLTLNVTGNLTKVVTSGTYTIDISVSGFPLPAITGDIDAFKPLPWGLGELNFTYSQEIPSAAPPGSYQVKISAVDQDKTQIFCINIAFTLSSANARHQPADVRMMAGHSKADELVMEGAISSSSQRPLNTLKMAASNVQRLTRPLRKLPPIQPVKPLNRRR